MIAIARLNIPAIFVYGGTIKAGHLNGKDLTVVSAFEAVGEFIAGKIDENELTEVEKMRCPGAGSCGGMYTANTMSSAIEAMGMSLPFSSTMAAEDEEKRESAKESARVLAKAVENNLLPSQIMTRKAFENAIAVVMATGGSTNAVLHLLAIAHSMKVDLQIEDFETIRRKVPVLCDLKPSGKYVATDLHKAGGIPLVMKILLENGVLHGDCLTITGKTIAENLERCFGEISAKSRCCEKLGKSALRRRTSRDFERKSRRRKRRRKNYRHQKPTNYRKSKSFRFRRRSDGRRLSARKIEAGDVVVIRYEGPKGGPGMREMLAPTSAIIGLGLGDSVGLDHRRQIFRRNLRNGRRTRRARSGGRRKHRAHRRRRSRSRLMPTKDFCKFNISDEELAKRREKWKSPNRIYARRDRQIRETRFVSKIRRGDGLIRRGHFFDQLQKNFSRRGKDRRCAGK